MSGVDMLISSIMRLAGVTPEQAKARAVEAYGVVVEVAASLKRIERNQIAIMAKLGVKADDGNDAQHGSTATGNPDGSGTADGGRTIAAGDAAGEAGTGDAPARSRKH